MTNSDKNFVPSPPLLQQNAKQELPAAPSWLTQPTLQSSLIERIRAGGTLEEIKEYYRFMREIETDQAKAAYQSAMAQAQAEMGTISRDMDNAQTRSRYASLAAVDKEIRPIYSKHGLAISFNTKSSEKGDTWIKIIAEVGLGSYSREFALDMPADGIGAKGGAVMTRTHATMSAITYGRRQLLKNIFNLAEADDDGNAAAGPRSSDEFFITPVEVEQLEKLIEESHFGSFETAFGIGKISELPRRRLQEAKDRLANFKAKYEERQAHATNA